MFSEIVPKALNDLIISKHKIQQKFGLVKKEITKAVSGN